MVGSRSELVLKHPAPWSCEGGAGYALWIMCDDKVTTVSSIKPRNMGIGQNIKLQYLSIFGEVHIH